MKVLSPLSLALCSLFSTRVTQGSEKAHYKGYVEADLLYWQTTADSLTFATTSDSPTTLSNAKALHPHFEWDFGFRAGGGVIFPGRKWNLSLVLTSLHNNAHRHVPQKTEKFLFPQWIIPADPLGGYADSAFMHWRLHLGLIDLALSYQIKCKKAFSFSTLAGLRGAIVRQKDNLTFARGTLFPGGEDNLRMKNKFFGVGPRLGVKTEWTPWPFICFFGGSSLSLAYGRLYLHQNEYASVGTTKRLSIHNVSQKTQTIADMDIGIEGIWRSSKGPMELHASLAWEELYLFGQEQLMRFLDPMVFAMNQGDLSLHGASFQLKWVF